MTIYVTVQQLINDAAAASGEYDPSEPLEAHITQIYLRALNNMLDSWSTESQAIYTVDVQSSPLVVGQAAYTIGPSGDFNVTRPAWIEYGRTDIQGVSYPMDPIGGDEYNAITYKSAGGIPNRYWFNSDMPTSTITLYPVPAIAMTMALGLPGQLTEYTNLATTLALPPGYQRALIFNLAVEAAPFIGVTPLPKVELIARQALAAIKRLNKRQLKIRLDIGRLRGPYWGLSEILSGQP